MTELAVQKIDLEAAKPWADSPVAADALAVAFARHRYAAMLEGARLMQEESAHFLEDNLTDHALVFAREIRALDPASVIE